MAVPEAAMHEADSSEATEGKIWRSRECPIMEPVSEPSRMQGSSQDQFGSRILPADVRHHPRARRLIYDVGHQTSYLARKRCVCTRISTEIANKIKGIRAALGPEFNRKFRVSGSRNSVARLPRGLWNLVPITKGLVIGRCLPSTRDVLGAYIPCCIFSICEK